MHLTRGTRLAQISGILPTSLSHRLLSTVCPTHHTKFHCLETFQIRRDMRAGGQAEGSPSCTTQFTTLHKLHKNHSWSALGRGTSWRDLQCRGDRVGLLEQLSLVTIKPQKCLGTAVWEGDYKAGFCHLYLLVNSVEQNVWK